MSDVLPEDPFVGINAVFRKHYLQTMCKPICTESLNEWTKRHRDDLPSFLLQFFSTGNHHGSLDIKIERLVELYFDINSSGHTTKEWFEIHSIPPPFKQVLVAIEEVDNRFVKHMRKHLYLLACINTGKRNGVIPESGDQEDWENPREGTGQLYSRFLERVFPPPESSDEDEN